MTNPKFVIALLALDFLQNISDLFFFVIIGNSVKNPVHLILQRSEDLLIQ